MQSHARIMGHAAHPLLIVLPLGLLSCAVIFDIVYLASNRVSFAVAAGYTIGIGILGGLAAAAFGLADWLAIPAGTRAKRIGAVHGIGNVIVVVLFAISWLLRMGADNGWRPPGIAMILSFAGIALAAFTGWLGGELVERLGVGINDGANLNAPSSLRGVPAMGPAIGAPVAGQRQQRGRTDDPNRRTWQ